MHVVEMKLFFVFLIKRIQYTLWQRKQFLAIYHLRSADIKAQETFLTAASFDFQKLFNYFSV